MCERSDLPAEGQWADRLTTEEVEATLSYVAALKGVAWASPMLTLTRPIIERLRVGLADKKAYRKNRLTSAETAFLYEIRFAHAIHRAGATAIYEHKTEAQDSSVDFKVLAPRPWLVELVSLRESAAVRSATKKAGVFTSLMLSTDANDPTQSEEGEVIKAQERIGEKVFDRTRKTPIKFPANHDYCKLIMVDARGYLGLANGDAGDWHHIAYGAMGLAGHLVGFWTDPKTKERQPIRGIFDPANKRAAIRTLQQRIHFIGFVCEKAFSPEEIGSESIYAYNPQLFSSSAAAVTAFKTFPLANDKLLHPTNTSAMDDAT